MERKFLIIDDVNMEYKGNIEDVDEPELNCLYLVGDLIYPYRGDLTKKSKAFGLYRDTDNDSIVFLGDSEYHIDDLNVQNVTLEFSDSSLLDRIKSMKPKETPKSKKTNTKKSSSSTKRKTVYTKCDDILKFDINEDDDLMVRLTKENVNAASITMNDVYEKFPNEGYNLYYGLLNRNTITLKSLNKWCEITNSEFDMSIKFKN